MCIIYLNHCEENRQFLLHAKANPSLKKQSYTTFEKKKQMLEKISQRVEQEFKIFSSPMDIPIKVEICLMVIENVNTINFF